MCCSVLSTSVAPSDAAPGDLVTCASADVRPWQKDLIVCNCDCARVQASGDKARDMREQEMLRLQMQVRLHGFDRHMDQPLECVAWHNKYNVRHVGHEGGGSFGLQWILVWLMTFLATGPNLHLSASCAALFSGCKCLFCVLH